MRKKNKVKQIVYFLTVGFFLLSGSVMVRGTSTKYVLLKREQATLLKSPTLKEEMRQSIEAVEQDLSDTELHLIEYRAPQPGILVPAFIQHVETLAKEEGVVISSISPLPQLEVFPMIKTPFQIELSGKFISVHRFLTRLEKSTLPVRIDTMKIMPGEGKNLEVSLATSILSEPNTSLSEKASSEKPLQGEALKTVFSALPYGSIEHALDIKRDIFFYPRIKSSKKRLKKKVIKKTRRKKPPQNPLDNARLSAVVYDKTGSMVLLNGVLLSVGDRYKGYTVMSIGKDQVLLMNEKNDHRVVIKGHKG